MSLLDDDEEELAVPVTDECIPVETMECVHKLLYKLEQHALALVQAAQGNPDVTLTFSRDGMVEVSSAILQLISIIKSKKYVS